jgi:hypothetical protein
LGGSDDTVETRVSTSPRTLGSRSNPPKQAGQHQIRKRLVAASHGRTQGFSQSTAERSRRSLRLVLDHLSQTGCAAYRPRNTVFPYFRKRVSQVFAEEPGPARWRVPGVDRGVGTAVTRPAEWRCKWWIYRRLKRAASCHCVRLSPSSFHAFCANG